MYFRYLGTFSLATLRDNRLARPIRLPIIL